MTTALILIDIQRDYFTGGLMELTGSTEASLKAAQLLAHFRQTQQHISTRSTATFFLPNTDGVRFHKNVIPARGEKVIEKHYPNSFRETELKEYLDTKGVREVVIAGMMTHMCIDATVRAAFDFGYSCTVAHDACATRGLTFNDLCVPADHVHNAYMAALASVYAKVAPTAAIITVPLSEEGEIPPNQP